jgi:hypothetical protein
MEALELKNTVLHYIETADERLLKVVKAVVESYRENDVVAFSVDGHPMTAEQYRQELLDAEAEIERGEYTTQEDLEKESENW